MRSKKKREKDTRINAGFISFKQYLILFFALLVICSSYNSVFMIYTTNHAPGDPMLGGMLIGNLIFLSLLVSLFYGFVKKYLFDKPIRRIAESARQIAGGDFTVRLQPIRKDGKKDEIEVLIEDFNKMAEELSTIETLKTDFISNVSHELKSPLSVIQSYATAIQDDTLTSEVRRNYGKIIVEAAKKLSELVTNILKINKLENQEIFPVAEPYALGEQLRECVLGFEELWEKKNISFIGDDIDDVVVSYDKTLIQLVWNNLISNAIKFTDEGGEVDISLKNTDNFAVVTIKDTGCGMSEETAARIFDKFYQGDTSHSTEGNGLGLTLVKKVIDIIDGKISVTSKLNEGTVFTVKLKI